MDRVLVLDEGVAHAQLARARRIRRLEGVAHAQPTRARPLSRTLDEDGSGMGSGDYQSHDSVVFAGDGLSAIGAIEPSRIILVRNTLPFFLFVL
jgi:hypothetical protein